MKKAALFLAVALVLFGCGKGSTPGAGPTAVKGPAPDFDLENIAGGKTKAADLKGKVLVVDFWATWCEPCIAEIPKFNKISDEYKGKDVQVVGITVESAHGDIEPMVKKTGMKYTVLVGNDAVVDGFGGLIGFPTTFVVTKDYKIYKKYMGALPDKDQRIKKDIEKLLVADGNTD
jgi:thiol-disulfide isomerase/thioredoxin